MQPWKRRRKRYQPQQTESAAEGQAVMLLLLRVFAVGLPLPPVVRHCGWQEVLLGAHPIAAVRLHGPEQEQETYPCERPLHLPRLVLRRRTVPPAVLSRICSMLSCAR